MNDVEFGSRRSRTRLRPDSQGGSYSRNARESRAHVPSLWGFRGERSGEEVKAQRPEGPAGPPRLECLERCSAVPVVDDGRMRGRSAGATGIVSTVVVTCESDPSTHAIRSMSGDPQPPSPR